MPFEKGNKGGPGRTKGPDKEIVHCHIIHKPKLQRLCDETGYSAGEVIDILIARCRALPHKK